MSMRDCVSTFSAQSRRARGPRADPRDPLPARLAGARADSPALMSRLLFKAYCPKYGCKRSTAKPFRAGSRDELVNHITAHGGANHKGLTAREHDYLRKTFGRRSGTLMATASTTRTVMTTGAAGTGALGVHCVIAAHCRWPSRVHCVIAAHCRRVKCVIAAASVVIDATSAGVIQAATAVLIQALGLMMHDARRWPSSTGWPGRSTRPGTTSTA